ncbi:hypothetical protein ACU4GD_19065 [Cupriavidus basilensis]
MQTPGGKPGHAGEARIDGVPGMAAPIVIDFLSDTAGSVCPALAPPTGSALDRLTAGAAATGPDDDGGCHAHRQRHADGPAARQRSGAHRLWRACKPWTKTHR